MPPFEPPNTPPPPAARDIPPDLPPAVAAAVVKGEYRYANFALAIGGAVAIAGLVMIILGVAGPVDLDFDVGSTKIHLATAVVGVVIAVVGVLIIALTRPDLRWAKKKGGKG
jgi:hypothetical protein